MDSLDVVFVDWSPDRDRHPLLDVEFDRLLENVAKARGRQAVDAAKAAVRAWVRKRFDEAVRLT